MPTVSIHADPGDHYPFFTGYAAETGHGEGEGHDLSVPLPRGSRGDAMVAALDRASARVRAFGADALVVALGFDAHRDDPLGVLGLDAQDFADVGARFQGMQPAGRGRAGRGSRH